eukprot:GFUD01038442.1.p1 GENE.GFUD01038442.1~~GFUD01038442.1.p1  ORF type:complete len:379 (+),score=41.05 GFUD01038442.1:26-1162(+)
MDLEVLMLLLLLVFAPVLYVLYLLLKLIRHKFVQKNIVQKKNILNKKIKVFTIDEGIPKDNAYLKRDLKTDIFVSYYSTLFTIFFWPRLVYVMYYDYDYDSANIVILVIIFSIYLFFSWLFGCHILCQITIPATNYWSESEALDYLTGPVACNGYLRIRCSHQETEVDLITESSYTTKDVTTYSEDIKIPVANWADITAPPCKDDLSASMTKLISKTPYLIVSEIIQAEPADEESHSNLKKFKQKYIDMNKHRDKAISATFFYKMLRNGTAVDDIVVFADNSSKPKVIFGTGYGCIICVSLLIGCPLIALLLLKRKIVRRIIVFKKAFTLISSQPRQTRQTSHTSQTRQTSQTSQTSQTIQKNQNSNKQISLKYYFRN